MIKGWIRKLTRKVYEAEIIRLESASLVARNRNELKLLELQGQIDQLIQQKHVMLADLASGDKFLRGSSRYGDVHVVIENLRKVLQDGQPMLIGNLLRGVILFKLPVPCAEPPWDAESLRSQMFGTPCKPVARRILNNIFDIVQKNAPFLPSSVFEGLDYREEHFHDVDSLEKKGPEPQKVTALPAPKKGGRPLGSKNKVDFNGAFATPVDVKVTKNKKATSASRRKK